MPIITLTFVILRKVSMASAGDAKVRGGIGFRELARKEKPEALHTNAARSGLFPPIFLFTSQPLSNCPCMYPIASRYPPRLQHIGASCRIDRLDAVRVSAAHKGVHTAEAAHNSKRVQQVGVGRPPVLEHSASRRLVQHLSTVALPLLQSDCRTAASHIPIANATTRVPGCFPDTTAACADIQPVLAIGIFGEAEAGNARDVDDRAYLDTTQTAAPAYHVGIVLISHKQHLRAARLHELLHGHRIPKVVEAATLDAVAATIPPVFAGTCVRQDIKLVGYPIRSNGLLDMAHIARAVNNRCCM